MPKIKTQAPAQPSVRRKYRKRERKPKGEVAMDIKRKILLEDRVCYNPKPFWQMTDIAIRCFASRQARQAAKSAPMTDEEMELYAGSIYHSIRYFNKRDPRYEEYMQYLKERRAAVEESRRIEAEKQALLSHIRQEKAAKRKQAKQKTDEGNNITGRD